MGLHCQAFHHLYCLYVTGVSSLCLDKPLTIHLRGKYHPCSLQDRKIIAKSLKGVVCKVCQEENGHLVILGLCG